MQSTDMKEQWQTALTCGYGCVGCVAARQHDNPGELHVPCPVRDMGDTKRTVLHAQRLGEYGSDEEWRQRLLGPCRPFMSPDRHAAHLEVCIVIVEPDTMPMSV